MNTFPWTQFAILLAASLLCSAAVLPYSLSLNAKMTQKLREGAGQPAGKKPLPPMPVLILLGVLQTVLLMSLATFLGLLAGQAIGLGLPILSAALDGRPVLGLILEMLPMAALLGLVSGGTIMALEAAYFMPRIPRALAGFDSRTAFWKRALACFYGGVVEEILLRLFVMGGLAWLIGLAWNTPAGTPAAGAFWLANFLAALLFGAGHLPATAAITKLTPIVVIRGLLLNGIPGVAFGYLYMRYGLEAAMLAHFSLDILIHLVFPPFMRLRLEALPPEAAPEVA